MKDHVLPTEKLFSARARSEGVMGAGGRRTTALTAGDAVKTPSRIFLQVCFHREPQGGEATRKEQPRQEAPGGRAENRRYTPHAGASSGGEAGARHPQAKDFMTTNNEPQQLPASAAIPEGYLTKAEVAKRLKKTVRTVENWQRRGIVPFVKCGRSVLFKWSDVETHLQANFRVCRLTVTK